MYLALNTYDEYWRMKYTELYDCTRDTVSTKAKASSKVSSSSSSRAVVIVEQ